MNKIYVELLVELEKVYADRLQMKLIGKYYERAYKIDNIRLLLLCITYVQHVIYIHICWSHLCTLLKMCQLIFLLTLYNTENYLLNYI